MEGLKRKLERQKRFTEDILAGMKDLVRVIDSNCRVIFTNKPMEELMGDINGCLCYKALGKDMRCDFCVSELSKLKDKVYIKEEIIKDKIYSVISSPIRDENGEIYATVEVFRDITEVKRLQQTIINQNLKMKRDIDFAKYIQKKILPPDGYFNDFIHLTSRYIPCEALGGDFYDIIQIDEENIGIYIADVAGHGVTSSMMTMFIKEAIENIGKAALDPSYVISQLNIRYRELNLDDYYYITILYGVYNTKKRLLNIVNGGHNCIPLVIRGNIIEEVFIPGLPICTLFNDYDYLEKTIELNQGDRLLLYTDGISEAENKEKEMYGSRIREIIKKKIMEDSPNIIDGIIKDVEEFATDGIKDDVAIMMIDVL